MRQILALLVVGVVGCSMRAPGPVDPSGAAPVQAEALVAVAFTEGPTVDRDGSVYFSEMITGRILRYTPARAAAEGWEALVGRVDTFRADSKGANGLVFDPSGRLIAAEGIARRITRTDMTTGEISVLAEHGPDSPIDMPNDVSFDGRGRIYFTDYIGKRIYRIDPDGTLEQILASPDIEAPNGIVVSPDDRTLYHVEANGEEGGARQILAYDLAEDGTVRNMRVLHDFYPGRSADGLAIDRDGNVYAAAGLHRTRGTHESLDTRPGVHVFAPDGRNIGFYPIWEDTVTNCAFGGEDLRTLYVTAGKTLFAIRTEVPGTRR